MIGVRVTTTDSSQQVLQAAEKAAFKNISHAAASTRLDAKASIQPGEGASPAGSPPHTHKGVIPRSILFDVDKQLDLAVVGTSYEIAGEGGAAHEQGGPFRDETFEKRAFMFPALERQSPRFGESFEGSIGE